MRRCCVASEDRKGQECERGDKINLGERVFFGSGPLTAPGLTGGCLLEACYTISLLTQYKERVLDLIVGMISACNTCNLSPYVLQFMSLFVH